MIVERSNSRSPYRNRTARLLSPSYNSRRTVPVAMQMGYHWVPKGARWGDREHEYPPPPPRHPASATPASAPCRARASDQLVLPGGGFSPPYEILYRGLKLLGFLRLLGALTCGIGQIFRRWALAANGPVGSQPARAETGNPGFDNEGGSLPVSIRHWYSGICYRESAIARCPS